MWYKISVNWRGQKEKEPGTEVPKEAGGLQVQGQPDHNGNETLPQK
jgi:hypothetical protein